jgi:streptogramin lyase
MAGTDEFFVRAATPASRMAAPNEHVVIRVPKARRKVVHVKAKRVRKLPKGSNAEGLAVQDDGTVWYVHDDEPIRLAVAKL